MDYTNLMKPGTRFVAKDALGETHRYQFVGLNLHDMICGTGCSYIILKDLDTGHEFGVEAQWFRFREISNVEMNDIIEVPCAAGMLCGEIGGNPDYPEVFTYLRRADDVEVGICVVCADITIPEGMTAKEVEGQTKYNGGLAVLLPKEIGGENYNIHRTVSTEELDFSVD